MIPKVFHFIWINRGREFGYEEYLSILSKILIYQSEYRYILWTNNPDMDFYHKSELLNKGLEVKNLFHEVTRLDPVKTPELWTYWDAECGLPFECDYYRMYLLNKLGGIYSDLDSMSVNKIPESLHKHHWVSCIEPIPGTDIPNGSVIGFFMCQPNNEYLYRFIYLRERILPKYASTMQLGLLCSNTENTQIIDKSAFIPFGWSASEFGSRLKDPEWTIHSHCSNRDTYEVHLYSDAIKHIEGGNSLLNKKLHSFENYLRQTYNY